jgi:hypothetical protein
MDTHNNVPLSAELVAVRTSPPIDLSLRARLHSIFRCEPCVVREAMIAQSPHS